MTPTQTATEYEAYPFLGTPDRAHIISQIMREAMRFETIFTDYTKACPERCGECAECVRCRAALSWMLSKPDSRIWEVWGEEGLAGILLLSRVVPGVDAEAHYIFFDGNLRSKTELLQGMIQWVFEDHPEAGWIALKRLTISIPDFAFALAKHAQKFLGFGGDFTLDVKGKTLRVEGVRRKVFRWRGMDRDLILMGVLNS